MVQHGIKGRDEGVIGGNVASLIRSSPRGRFWGEKSNTDSLTRRDDSPSGGGARHGNNREGGRDKGGARRVILAMGLEGKREKSGDTCAIGVWRQARYFSVARRRQRDVSRKSISRGRSIDRSRGLSFASEGEKRALFLGKIKEAKRRYVPCAERNGSSAN